jgi:hypothetical protein
MSGPEILVAQSGHPGRGIKLRVFGGQRDGGLRRIASWSLFRKTAGERAQLEVATGDVLGDAEHAGEELVVASPGGRLYVFGLRRGRHLLLRRIEPFPDRRAASAARFAVGDFRLDRDGDEIAVGDDGSAGDGLVRLLDPRSGEVLAELHAAAPGEARAGVELWAGDVDPAFSGSELIAGQGSGGGRLRIFSLSSAVPRFVAEVPNPLGRRTSYRAHVAAGDILPGLSGAELVVADADAAVPLQVFSFLHGEATLQASVVPGSAGRIAAVVVPP